MAVLCREEKFPYLRSFNLKVVEAEKKNWDYDLLEISQE